MATFYGVNYTKFNTPTPENKVQGNEYNAPVRFVHDSYECSATAKGSQIYLAKVPKGALILPESRIYHDNLGANSALAVGIAEYGVELSASEATTAAGDIQLGGDVDSFGTALTANSDIIVTVSGTGAATGTIRLALYYANF
jgi:hypothetical protein